MPANGQAELSQLIAKERDALIESARRIIKDPQAAEDVVQDTLLSLLRRQKAEPVRNLRRYMFKAVHFNSLKCLAGINADRSLAEGDAVTQDSDDHGESTIDPATLELAIRQLPDAQQAVIRMRYYMGLRFRDIGEVLSISINTAASRCRYALASLRKLMAGRGGD